MPVKSCMTGEVCNIHPVRGKDLNLEAVFTTSDALSERERELIGIESCFHDAVHVDFVRRHSRVTERSRFHPLNSNVLEVHCPARQQHTSIQVLAVVLC